MLSAIATLAGCCWVILATAVRGETLYIHNAKDLIQFSNDVNYGTTYRKTTVYLDADIDFSGGLSSQFVPIGQGLETNNFQGVFDGQGHAIRNLAITTYARGFYGLFGYSDGATVRNVVLDASCSVVDGSDTGSSEISVGSVLGYCETYDYPCFVESVVNMADVTFTASDARTTRLRIGGIVGEFYAEFFPAHVRNCANYGTVTHAGASAYTTIGGIVGSPEGSYSTSAVVQNCVNYGAVVLAGTTTTTINAGGIVGGTGYLNNTFDNCVSLGSITFTGNSSSSRSSSTGPATKRVGAVVGSLYKARATHCYWDSAFRYEPCGHAEAGVLLASANFSKSSFVLSKPVMAGYYSGCSLLEALNAEAEYYAAQDELAKWALNKNAKSVTFRVNGDRTLMKTNALVVLLPNLASEGETRFEGWFVDEACTTLLKDFNIVEDTVLYGKWNEKKGF